MDDDDVTVLLDREAVYDDGTVVAVRILGIPRSDTYPEGIKYKFHYSVAADRHPIVRFDNHHGPHELHLRSNAFEIEFLGLAPIARAFRAALPPDKRTDWQRTVTDTHAPQPAHMTRTLHIHVGTMDTFDGVIDDLETLDAGDDIETDDSVLAVESTDTLGRILRPTNLDILTTIVQQEPQSIRDLARRLDRGPAEVLDNLNELENYGLIAFEQDGRAKRPVVWYDEIDVDIQLSSIQRGDADATLA